MPIERLEVRKFAEQLMRRYKAPSSPKARTVAINRLRLESLEPRVVLNSGPLIISEFMAINDTVRADEDHDHPDWIEIHNPTKEPVVLDGWHLTDNPADLTKWEFPDHLLDAETTLGPGDFLTVFASNKNRRVAGAPLHTNFVLDTHIEVDGNRLIGNRYLDGGCAAGDDQDHRRGAE